MSEVGTAIAFFRLGKVLNAMFDIFRILAFTVAFKSLLKLRESAAKLPPQQLSDFLCQTVLVKGTAAMVLMLFFSFETVACFISEKSVDNEACENTSEASVWLSFFLTLITVLSICSKSVQKSVQREMAWTMSAIATLNLKWWQQLQGGLVIIAGITALYLLSVVGVEGTNPVLSVSLI